MTARAKLSIGWIRETPGAGWSIPKPSPEARKPSVDSKPPQGILRLPQWIRTSLRGRDALILAVWCISALGIGNLAHSFWEISLPTSICADMQGASRSSPTTTFRGSSTAFEKVHELARQARVSVDFKHGNAESMPLAAESFDLIGLGVALDRACPAWFGWSGFAVSAATLVTGITWFAGVDLVPELTLWAALQPLEWLWLLVLGVMMWRESNTAREAAIG